MHDKARSIRDVTHVRTGFNDTGHKMEPAPQGVGQPIGRRGMNREVFYLER
jgi:hypothetical protein